MLCLCFFGCLVVCSVLSCYGALRALCGIGRLVVRCRRGEHFLEFFPADTADAASEKEDSAATPAEASGAADEEAHEGPGRGDARSP